jgi:hypothetical protein
MNRLGKGVAIAGLGDACCEHRILGSDRARTADHYQAKRHKEHDCRDHRLPAL